MEGIQSLRLGRSIGFHSERIQRDLKQSPEPKHKAAVCCKILHRRYPWDLLSKETAVIMEPSKSLV